MYIYIKRIVCLFCVLFSLAISAVDAYAEDEPVISDIEVQGLRRLDMGTVLDRMSQRPGAPLSPKGVTNDIKAVFALGYFDDVSVEVRVVEGGLNLVYVVKEKPSIRRVDFYGNEEVTDSDIEQVISISPGSMSDRVLVQENAEVIKALLASKGFPKARVIPVLRDVSSENLLLTYYIDEGPEVRIDEIRFEGNSVFTSDDLRGEMKTAEWWFMSGLTGSGYLDQLELQQDVLRLMQLYHKNGYIKASVHEPVIEYEQGDEWLDIKIAVDEGLQYSVANISFYGGTLYGDDELKAAIKTTEGDLLNRQQLMGDVKTITDMLSKKGYALATVRPDFRVDDAARTVGLAFNINEGDIYHVGRIEVHGNYKTRDKVIRREVRLDEGDTFDSEKLQKSFRALMNLNFFGDLKINPRPDASRRVLDLDVDIEEKLTGSFSVGGGYSSVDKFMGMMDLTFGNFGGRGQYLKVMGRVSSSSTTYEIEFRDPWLLDKPVSFSTSIYNKNTEYDYYDTKSSGFTLGMGKRFWEYWSAGVRYKYDKTTIKNISDSATSIVRLQEGESVTSSISPYMVRDTRDNFMMPHEGTKLRMDIMYAGLGGDNYYFKWSLDAMGILPVTKRSELSVRARYGYAIGLNDDPLPVYERFRVGSVYTVRGLRDLGPRDENGNYIGGGQRIILNSEYTLSASEDGTFKWLAFWDGGTAFDKEINMRYTAGAGFKWFSPMGPLSLVWANNLFPVDGESSYRWEFSIGTMF